MRANELILDLFGKGLSELLVLHTRQQDVCLGNLVLEKGRLIIRDQGLLTGFKPKQFEPCAEDGLLGMVTAARGQGWESLSFFGLNRCDLPIDLSRTRHGALTAAQNQYGDSLIDFVGSVYRGYQLMLDHHFLPVIMLREVNSKDGNAGLVVSDLRVVPMDLSVIRKINDVVRKSVERQLSLDVQDMEVISEEFDKLFPGYVSESPAAAPPQSSKTAAASAAPARSAAAKPPEPALHIVPPPAPRPAAPAAAPAARGAALSGAVSIATARAEPRREAAPSPLQGFSPVLRFLKLAVGELGEARAFELFENWAAEFLSAEVRRIFEHLRAPTISARQFFDAAKAHFERYGERLELVEEAPDHVVHEIHDCMYRQACLSVGGINMDKWGTCMQVIPTARDKAAAAADPTLEWMWNRCDRRAGQACLYEIRRRAAKG